MTAITTTRFKYLNAKHFKDLIDGSPADSIYVFIGKSDAWSDDMDDDVDGTPDTPVNGVAEFSRANQNMIAMKKIGASDVMLSAKRYTWESGTTYVAWDDNDSLIYTKQFYVVTDELKVFKCLKTGASTSTAKPTHTGYTPIEYADGYVWHYMYTVEGSDVANFLNQTFIPVQTATSASARLTYQQNCAANIGGGIWRIVVTEGGAGYTSPPTVTLVGDGSGASATATVSGGAVTAIEISGSPLDHGTGYTKVKVVIAAPDSSPGTQATARGVLSPENGHGTDPEEELGGYYVQLSTSFDYDDGSGDFIVDNDYRTIGVIRNPYTSGSPSVIATASTLSCLSEISLTGVTGTFQVDEVVTTPSAAAFVDAVDDSGSPVVLKVHQNNKTSFGTFTTSQTATGGTSTADGTISALGDGEYEKGSGEILFIENLEPINRSDSQIEEIRIVIQF